MSKKQPKIEVYTSKGGQRWRLRSANGRIVAESGEALKPRSAIAWVGYFNELQNAFYDAKLVIPK